MLADGIVLPPPPPPTARGQEGRPLNPRGMFGLKATSGSNSGCDGGPPRAQIALRDSTNTVAGAPTSAAAAVPSSARSLTTAKCFVSTVVTSPPRSPSYLDMRGCEVECACRGTSSSAAPGDDAAPTNALSRGSAASSAAQPVLRGSHVPPPPPKLVAILAQQIAERRGAEKQQKSTSQPLTDGDNNDNKVEEDEDGSPTKSSLLESFTYRNVPPPPPPTRYSTSSATAAPGPQRLLTRYQFLKEFVVKPKTPGSGERGGGGALMAAAGGQQGRAHGRRRNRNSVVSPLPIPPPAVMEVVAMNPTAAFGYPQPLPLPATQKLANDGTTTTTTTMAATRLATADRCEQLEETGRREFPDANDNGHRTIPTSEQLQQHRARVAKRGITSLNGASPSQGTAVSRCGLAHSKRGNTRVVLTALDSGDPKNSRNALGTLSASAEAGHGSGMAGHRVSRVASAVRVAVKCYPTPVRQREVARNLLEDIVDATPDAATDLRRRRGGCGDEFDAMRNLGSRDVSPVDFSSSDVPDATEHLEGSTRSTAPPPVYATTGAEVVSPSGAAGRSQHRRLRSSSNSDCCRAALEENPCRETDCSLHSPSLDFPSPTTLNTGSGARTGTEGTQEETLGSPLSIPDTEEGDAEFELLLFDDDENDDDNNKGDRRCLAAAGVAASQQHQQQQQQQQPYVDFFNTAGLSNGRGEDHERPSLYHGQPTTAVAAVSFSTAAATQLSMEHQFIAQCLLRNSFGALVRSITGGRELADEMRRSSSSSRFGKEEHVAPESTDEVHSDLPGVACASTYRVWCFAQQRLHDDAQQAHYRAALHMCFDSAYLELVALPVALPLIEAQGRRVVLMLRDLWMRSTVRRFIQTRPSPSRAKAQQKTRVTSAAAATRGGRPPPQHQRDARRQRYLAEPDETATATTTTCDTQLSGHHSPVSGRRQTALGSPHTFSQF